MQVGFLAPAAAATYDHAVRRLALLAIMLAACGPRAVLGHGARDPASDSFASTDRALTDWQGPPGSARGAPGSRLSTPITNDDLLATAPTPTIIVVSAASIDPPSETRPTGIIISRLPAPHRVEAAESPAPRTIVEASALVGRRDSRESLAFALSIASSLGGVTPAITNGPALVAWAREQGAFIAVGAAPRSSISTGDLLVFDRAVAGEPASLIGVALATDARGVTAFLYLARGVIRIGHLDPARPALARDREGRTVNSYIRHTSDYPPAGTRFLAGELLSGAISLR